ncbi:MAG TPA: DnaJ domain-containing protein [Thermoanaerobaculia bacterium]|nr:DnaJ domain-containing protein [Thermoanaerobaculia bacterium]
MELIAIIFMLAAGTGIAVFVAAATAMAKAEQERAAPSHSAMPAPERDRIAASLLVQILLAGGLSPDEAMREVRRRAGIAAPVTPGIDVCNWAEAFARVTNAQQRASLLESAVQLAAARAQPVPLGQYAALLDLSFGLGFQTDALAKLRTVYGFEYVDHAKDARPREADRSGGSVTLFARDTRPADQLLAVLGLSGTPTRQGIITAYRRLAAQHHPDRYYEQPADVQSGAAARFIEITRAYEQLMSIYRE